jgi:tRNA dimethylallyltransferase
VRRLMASSKPMSRTARQALGYKEVIDFIEKRGSLEETIRLVQTRTRQFAKRQHTWFRHLEECRAVEIAGTESPREVAERLMAISRERMKAEG